MFLSVFDIFKIGIGPSSSHTMGPMIAAHQFIQSIREQAPELRQVDGELRLHVRLFGSLAFTGKGHASDLAVFYGLMGYKPDEIDVTDALIALNKLRRSHRLILSSSFQITFDPEADLIFDIETKPEKHPNTLAFALIDPSGTVLVNENFVSIGGGFVLEQGEYDPSMAQQQRDDGKYPFGFQTAAQMLEMSKQSGLTIAEMKRENELVDYSPDALDAGLLNLWHKMNACIDRGLENEGELPGGLAVKRRAKSIKQSLEKKQLKNAHLPHEAVDWLSVYAMAVNEENAAGGQVVTSPTNGAAGIVPAVLRYYHDHCDGDKEGIKNFLLTASAIGGLIKHNGSISGAECGCQAEVGSASAMAAAGLCAALGGDTKQIENAAEIALEHHLGLTCDPVGGLVQVPCIERNGLGAIKAMSAASLALHGDGEHLMPLDNCIEAMRQTGADMAEKYKETSLGGLAVNLPGC